MHLFPSVYGLATVCLKFQYRDSNGF
jgi:hypothetical protein